MKKLPRHLLFAAFSLALGAAAYAQDTESNPKSTSGSTAPQSDLDSETVKLSPFSVTGSSTHGYVASESTTGTRVATKIQDLPFVVNVVTSEFLNDFDFFDIGENFGYVSSLSSVDTEGNYFLRGFPGTFYLWNGFYRLGVIDRFDVERVEVIKGPNASIYGQTSPAGVLNIVTKKPTANPFEDAKFTMGSFSTRRFEAHLNTPLGTLGGLKVYNYMAVSWYDKTNDINSFNWLHSRGFSNGTIIKFNDHSELYNVFEWTKRLENSGSAKQGYEETWVPTVSGGKVTGASNNFNGQLAPLAEARLSQVGPNEFQNRELTSLNTVYENQFNDAWSLRSAIYYYDRHNSEIDNTVDLDFLVPGAAALVPGTIKPPSGLPGFIENAVLRSTSVTRTRLNENGGAAQADILAHYFLFHKSIETRSLITFDWSQNWRYRLESQLPNSINNSPLFVLAANPQYVAIPQQDLFTVVTRNDKTRWDTIGFLGREQVGLFKNRLLLYTGARHDQVTYNFNFGNQYNVSAPATIKSAGAFEHFVNTAWTLAGGANFKVTPNVAAYGNYSQSFQPTAQLQKLGDPPLGNTRASGVDYGVKCNFFNNRLQFTAGGYYVIENGLKVKVTTSSNLSLNAPAGSQGSKGAEGDFSFQITDGLDLQGGYGWVNARLFKEGTNTNADGRRPQNVPIETGNLALKYSFKGTLLKGVSTHLGLRYVGLSYPQTLSGTSGQNSIVESGIKVPPYETVDWGISYKWVNHVFGQKFSESVSFSIDNLLNRDYVSPKLSPQPPRSFFVSYSIKH